MFILKYTPVVLKRGANICMLMYVCKAVFTSSQDEFPTPLTLNVSNSVEPTACVNAVGPHSCNTNSPPTPRTKTTKNNKSFSLVKWYRYICTRTTREKHRSETPGHSLWTQKSKRSRDLLWDTVKLEVKLL